jgi:hypothetical protein
MGHSSQRLRRVTVAATVSLLLATANTPLAQHDGKLAVLASAVESSDSASTQNDYEVFKSLSGRLDSVLAQWKDIRDKDLVSLNEMAWKESIPLLSLRPPPAELSQD